MQTFMQVCISAVMDSAIIIIILNTSWLFDVIEGVFDKTTYNINPIFFRSQYLFYVGIYQGNNSDKITGK